MLSESRTRARDPHWDNARFIAVALIVVVHLTVPMTDRHGGWGSGLQGWLSVFRMPVIVILSGYLSKGAERSAAWVRRATERLLIPYLVFQLLYALFMRWLHGDAAVPLSPASPIYALWFLPALWMWRVATPFLARARRWVVPGLIVAGLGAGVIGAHSGSLIPRALAYFPLFWFGYRIRPKAMQRLVARRRAGAIILAVSGVASIALGFHRSWLSVDLSYSESGLGFAGPLVRIVWWGAAIVLSLAFFAVVPRARTRMTRLGCKTMYPYVLHGFVVVAVTESPWYARAGGATPIALAIAGLALAWYLSSDLIVSVAEPFVQPLETLARARRAVVSVSIRHEQRRTPRAPDRLTAVLQRARG